MTTNNFRRMTKVAVAGAMLVAWSVFGLGSDYRNDQPVGGTTAWPEGVRELVNVTNRVHGFFVNDEDVFFFAGNTTNFNEFLAGYSKILGIEKHRIVLHGGVGEARSPWSTNGQACDWKLYAYSKSWLAHDPKQKTFVLEVHFWTGGKIALDQVAIPKGVEFGGDCLKGFKDITNGMTRAEVEKRLSMDGGLQGASPVRYLDAGCNCFKVNVEFDFKRDAADQNRAISSKDDKVTRVSKPYLEQPFLD
jgi:hypothetical protein